MSEEYFEYLEELEESLHKGMKVLQKAKQKIGQMGFRDGGGYGNRFNNGGFPSMMGPMMGNPMQGGFPGQMGFRDDEMMERRGRYSRG